jgi:hypothetical protein
MVTGKLPKLTAVAEDVAFNNSRPKMGYNRPNYGPKQCQPTGPNIGYLIRSFYFQPIYFSRFSIWKS